MTNIKVIGIDPAPSKKSTIFDGKVFLEMDCFELKTFLSELKKEHENILICWDAPLSFIPDNTNFNTRTIESYFNKKVKPPKGVTVQGFAGCPHWAISQYLLGYPKVGDCEVGVEPPFELVFDRKAITKSVTEVHPGLAIWVWLKDVLELNNNWPYKKDSTIRIKIVSALRNLFPDDQLLAGKIQNDDQLDAYVAWKLGRVWVDNAPQKTKVEILGDINLGSFLLPYDQKIFEGLKKFVK